jgi:hypothetical protein
MSEPAPKTDQSDASQERIPYPAADDSGVVEWSLDAIEQIKRNLSGDDADKKDA